MKRLLTLFLISCSTITGQAQSTGNVRTSIYSGGQWNTGTFTGSGVMGVNTSGTPSTISIVGSQTSVLGSVSGTAASLRVTGSLSVGDGSAGAPIVIRKPANGNLDGGIRFRNAADTDWDASLWWNEAHPDELQMDSVGSISINAGQNAAGDSIIQLGPTSFSPIRVIIQRMGSATAGIPIRPSHAFGPRTSWWNGSSSVTREYLLQAIPTSATEGYVKWVFGGTLVTTSTSAYVTGGTEVLRVDDNGPIFSGLSSPAFTSLATSATVTITPDLHKSRQFHEVTLGTGTSTLLVNSASSGMNGEIWIKQSSTGTSILNFPTNTATPGPTLSTGADVIDVVSWSFNGLFFVFTKINSVESPVDPDAADFISRAGISDPTQESAINTLVIQLKAASLWTRFYALYPFVGGTSTAHAENLISSSYQIGWTGTVTHNANGITGDGSTGYGNSNFNFNAVSAVNSACIYLYCKTQTPTASRYFTGATTTASSSRVGITQNGSTLQGVGLNNNVIGGITISLSDYRRHIALNRSTNSAQQIYQNSTASSVSDTATAAPSHNVYILARNSNGTADSFSNANLAFAGYGQSLSAGEWTTFRAIIDTFQTALGRAN